MSYLRRKNCLFLHPSVSYNDIELAKLRKLSGVTILPLYKWTTELQHSVSPIIIVDFSCHELKLPLRDFTDISKEEFNNISIVVTHTPRKVKTTELIALGNLKGVFYQNQSLAEIAQGLQTLEKGQNWLSRETSTQLLEYYHSVVVRFSPPHSVRLTRRELEVLGKMRVGMSNAELADHLFLSEHTIKSHLYKIYKKLNIESRDQAVEWAHHFMP